MKKQKILFVKVPSEQGSLDRNKGCRLAPEAIAKKLGHCFEFDSVKVAEGDIERTDEAIFGKAMEVFSKKRFVAFVGGDHSISYSLFRAFSARHENTALIVFDAHPDCVQFFKPLSHEDWVQGIIEEKLVGEKNVLLLGVRKIHSLEQKFLKKKRIQMIKANQIKKNLKKSLIELEKFLENQKSIYLSIDIDVFDPKIAPGTGCPEKNGLLEKEFFALFGKILQSGKLRAMDLVEVNPLKDKRGKTIKLAAGILGKIGQKPAWARPQR